MTSREAAHQAAKILSQAKSARLRRIAVRLIKIEGEMMQIAEKVRSERLAKRLGLRVA